MITVPIQYGGCFQELKKSTAGVISYPEVIHTSHGYFHSNYGINYS